MKNLIIVLLIFAMISPAYAAKIKIKSGHKIDAAQEAVVKLNQQAMEKNDVFVVPRGRRIYSRLNDNITRSNAMNGNIITTQLMKDWGYKANMVAPEGSLVKGVITKKSATSMEIKFDTIIRPDNVEVRIVSKPIIITSDKDAIQSVLIPFGTEFTIQIINDVITKPYR